MANQRSRPATSAPGGDSVDYRSKLPALAETAAAGGRQSRLWIASNVRSSDITVFLRQLIMLLEAGTPLLKSLKTLAARSQRPGIRGLVHDIAEYVEAGNPLWQAFERHPRYFDQVTVNLIKASEASGTLIPVLRRITQYRERREILVKRVYGAMLYPVVLVLACVGVLALMAWVVIPSFEDLFTRLDVEVPAFTQNFIATVNFIVEWWWVGFVALAALVIIYRLLVRNPLYRLYADRMKLKIPIMGSILRKFGVVEFTRSLALLLKSGMSMMVTLDLVRNAIHNQALSHTVQQLRDSVEEGRGLEEPLREASDLIPPVVTDMLITGEESGQLDDIAEQIADTYDEEVNIEINTLGDALVPVIVLFIGAVVLLLALALFRPMLDMIDTLGGGMT